MSTPLAYFITFTCHGTWLHGDPRGSVDREHNTLGTPVLSPDPARQAHEQGQLAEPPYLLDRPRRQVTLDAICEIAGRKNWSLHAVHVRSNHVHVVVTAHGPAERVMNDIKTAASRRLNKAFPAERDRKRWIRHGSTRYVWTEEAVSEKVKYVLDEQGEPMARFPPSRARSAAGVSGGRGVPLTALEDSLRARLGTRPLSIFRTGVIRSQTRPWCNQGTSSPTFISYPCNPCNPLLTFLGVPGVLAVHPFLGR
jgi:REP element-mobilizing transposase RayT